MKNLVVGDALTSEELDLMQGGQRTENVPPASGHL